MLKTKKNSNVLCRVSSGGHSAKWALPSVLGWHSAKKRKVVFAECPGWHSAKKASLPSAADLALGKSFFKNKKKSLPSAASRALGKEHELSRSNGFSLFSLSLTLTRCTPAPPARRRPARPCPLAATRRRPPRRRPARPCAPVRPRRPRAQAPAPPARRAPAPPARRAPAPPARRAPARRPRPPTNPRRRPPRRQPLTTSTPSRPFAVVHRPRRANRYKLIFTF
jgi:hypothetical protein